MINYYTPDLQIKLHSMAHELHRTHPPHQHQSNSVDAAAGGQRINLI